MIRARVAQTGERDVANVEVAGSTPAARSFPRLTILSLSCLLVSLILGAIDGLSRLDSILLASAVALILLGQILAERK